MFLCDISCIFFIFASCITLYKLTLHVFIVFFSVFFHIVICNNTYISKPFISSGVHTENLADRNVVVVGVNDMHLRAAS